MAITYEGRPCRHGHTTRYERDGKCVSCAQAKARVRYETRKKKTPQAQWLLSNQLPEPGTGNFRGWPCAKGHTLRQSEPPHRCAVCAERQEAKAAKRAEKRAAKVAERRARKAEQASLQKSAWLEKRRARAASRQSDLEAVRLGKEVWLSLGNELPSDGQPFEGWPCAHGHQMRFGAHPHYCLTCTEVTRYQKISKAFSTLSQWVLEGGQAPSAGADTFHGWACSKGHTTRLAAAPFACAQCGEEQASRKAEPYLLGDQWAEPGSAPPVEFREQRVRVRTDDPKTWLARIVGSHDTFGFSRKFLERHPDEGAIEFEIPENTGLYELGRVPVDGAQARGFFYLSANGPVFLTLDGAQDLVRAGMV